MAHFATSCARMRTNPNIVMVPTGVIALPELDA
jgi:hypothetical protein